MSIVQYAWILVFLYFHTYVCFKCFSFSSPPPHSLPPSPTHPPSVPLSLFSGSGSTDPIESGSNSDQDPDPKPGCGPWGYGLRANCSDSKFTATSWRGEGGGLDCCTVRRPGAYLGFGQGGCTFLADLHPPPPPPDLDLDPGKILSWIRIRIRIKTMRIHSPGLNCQKIVV